MSGFGGIFLIGAQGLTPQEFGELAVDDTEGGQGLDGAKLVHGGVFAKAVRCNLETAAIRYREDGGAPTAASGVPRVAGDEFWVYGQQALGQFRAIRQTADSAKITYTVYF